MPDVEADEQRLRGGLTSPSWCPLTDAVATSPTPPSANRAKSTSCWSIKRSDFLDSISLTSSIRLTISTVFYGEKKTTVRYLLILLSVLLDVLFDRRAMRETTTTTNKDLAGLYDGLVLYLGFFD